MARLRDWIFPWKREPGKPVAEGRVMANLAQTLESYGAAVAFAEEGQRDIAQEMIRKTLQEEPKIVVLGSQGLFSRAVTDYAIGFARRTGYEMIVLSCAPDGQTVPANGAADLLRRAAEEGIHCRHVVKCGASDKCIRDVHDEFRRVEFVVTEPDPAFEHGADPVIPVFCLSE
jgi:hypothetical protein